MLNRNKGRGRGTSSMDGDGVPLEEAARVISAQGGNMGRLLAVGVAIVIALAAFLQSYVLIDAGHVGVVTQFGAVTGAVYEPGFHLKLPFAQDVQIFDVRTQKEQVEATAASKDLQAVKSVIALNYHLDATQASTVYQEIGIFYKERVIDPAIQEAFKSATAQFTAEELITKRTEVKNLAQSTLSEQLKRSHVIVDDLNIVNFDFSEAFNEAIEAKQVASQQVLTARQELEKSRVAAEQRLVEAKARADSQIIEAEAAAKAQQLQQQSLTELYIQNKAVDKWNGQLPQYTGGTAIPFIVPPVTGQTSSTP
jgi:regulator of protease activity HflC (stomatin/prohibitin superfamily)